MSPRQTALLASVLLVAAVAGPAAIAGPVTATADHVSIQGESFDVHRGDVVAFPVSVPAGSNATVLVQRTTNAVTSRATVQDDGDGRVVAVLNTYTGRLSTRGDDQVLNSRVPREPPLPADTYSVSVSTGDGADRTTLIVEDGGLDRLGVWRVPNGTPSLSSASAVRDAITDGRVVRANTMTSNDHLILQVDAPGLTGAYEAASGPNATARFRSVLSTHGDLAVVQRYPTPELQRATIQVLDGAGTTVLPDPENDTYYVRVNLSRVPVWRGDTRVEEFRFEDQQLRVSVELYDNSNLTSGNETLTAYVDDRVARVHRAPDDRVHLFPAANQTVTGTTAVGTGWDVTVVIRATDDPDTETNESYSRRADATVRATEDGRDNAFRATLDLSDAPAATSVEVDVRFENRSLLENPVPGRIAGSTSALSIENQENGTYARVRVAASLARGGFVVLHAGSADGPVVGFSEYRPPGVSNATVYVGRPTNATTVVAVAHADANHNQWFDGPDVDIPYADPAMSTFDIPRMEIATTEPPSTTGEPPSTTTSGTTHSTTEITGSTTTMHPDPGARAPVPAPSPAVVFVVLACTFAIAAWRRR